MEKKKRICTRKGDIFCVVIDNEYKCYFQYITTDKTQLNSSVIRVFKKRYDMSYVPNFDEIVKGEIMFYSHTVLRTGIEFGAWEKVGKHKDLGDTENIMFRDWRSPSDNYVPGTLRWLVWKINCEWQSIGELPKKYESLEIGVVRPYFDIVNIIKTGNSSFLGFGRPGEIYKVNR